MFTRRRAARVEEERLAGLVAAAAHAAKLAEIEERRWLARLDKQATFNATALPHYAYPLTTEVSR